MAQREVLEIVLRVPNSKAMRDVLHRLADRVWDLHVGARFYATGQAYRAIYDALKIALEPENLLEEVPPSKMGVAIVVTEPVEPIGPSAPEDRREYGRGRE